MFIVYYADRLSGDMLGPRRNSQIIPRSLLGTVLTLPSLSTALARSVAHCRRSLHLGLLLRAPGEVPRALPQEQHAVNQFSLSSHLAQPEDRNVGPNATKSRVLTKSRDIGNSRRTKQPAIPRLSHGRVRLVQTPQGPAIYLQNSCGRQRRSPQKQP